MTVHIQVYINNKQCLGETPALFENILCIDLTAYFPDDGKVYLKELGLRTVIPFNIYAVPRPDVKYEIKNPDGTYKTVAEIEPAGTMYVGADEYLVDANSGHFTILKAEKKHEGDYRVETTQLGVPKSAFFKLRVGSKFCTQICSVSQ